MQVRTWFFILLGIIGFVFGAWVDYGDTSLLRQFKLLGSDDTTVANVISYEGCQSLGVVQQHRSAFVVHLDADSIIADEGFMLIDLSDTTNWPHTNTGHVVLEHVFINANPDASFQGIIELGFLDNVDATDGDFRRIHGFDLSQQASEIVSNLDFTSGFDLKTTSLFGPTDANNVTWQTDVNLQGPDGASSYPSGDGDFVMFIDRAAGTVDVDITVVYVTKT